jgi:hypothetical protein
MARRGADCQSAADWQSASRRRLQPNKGDYQSPAGWHPGCRVVFRNGIVGHGFGLAAELPLGAACHESYRIYERARQSSAPNAGRRPIVTGRKPRPTPGPRKNYVASRMASCPAIYCPVLRETAHQLTGPGRPAISGQPGPSIIRPSLICSVRWPNAAASTLCVIIKIV